MMFRFVPPMLRPMAATGVPPREMVIALAFTAAVMAAVATVVPPKDKGALAFAATAAAAASMFGGGEVGVCAIVALLGESWV